MTTPGGGYSAGSIFLQVVPSFRGFQEEIRRYAKVVDKAMRDELQKGADSTGRDVGDKVGRGLNESIGRHATEMRKQIEAAMKALPKVTLDADARPADRQLQLIRARLESLHGADFTVDANTKRAEAMLGRLRDELREIALRNTDVDIVVNAGHAYAEIKKLSLELDRLGMKRTHTTVEVDTDKSQAGLRGLMSDLDSTGSSFRAFNGILLAAVAIGPVLIPMLAAIAAGLVALGPAAIAGAAGIGVTLLAFSGIQNAVKALNDVDKNAAKDNLANSKAMRTAAKGVRDAQQGLDQARLQAARTAEDSAQRVQDALRNQTRAERDYQDSLKQEKAAQQELSKAREDARQKVIDLQDSLAGGALAERQAVIDLFNATVSYRNAMADPGATNLEKEQASINLGNAQLSLKQIREQNAALRTERAQANKTGIEGSAGVVAAHGQVAAAHDAVLQAQERVQDAIRATAHAREEEARSAVDSQRQIRDATERVSDAQAAYQEALAKTGDVGSSSVQKLNDAMAMLTPSGQAFARFLFGLKDEFIALKGAAADGFLPGLQKAMQSLITTYGPGFLDFVRSISKVLGDLAQRGAKALESPMWQRFFGMMAKYAPILLDVWSQIGGKLLTALANIMTAFAPFALEMANGLNRLLDSVVKWTDGLSQNKGFQSFLDYVREVGPQVMDFFGALVGALLNLGRALAPYASQLLKIFTGFLNWIAHMNPKTLGAVAVGIIAIVTAIQLVVGTVALLGTLATAIGVLEALGAAGGAAAAGILATAGIIVLAVFAIVAIFAILYIKSATFRDIVNGVFHAIGAVVMWLWHNIIEPYFKLIWAYWKFVADVFISVADLIIHIFMKLWGELTKEWNAFLKTGAGKTLVAFWKEVLVPAIKEAVREIQSIWEGLKAIFLTPIKFLVETVLNNGLIKGFNWIADKVGSKKIDRITIFDAPTAKQGNNTIHSAGSNKNNFATGGMVPGFSPHDRADNIPAWLTAGEFVLPVGAVRRLKATGGEGLLELLRQGQFPGYSGGGIVKGIKKIGGFGVAGNDVDALADPLGWLQKQVRHLYGKLNDTAIGKLIIGVPETLAKGAADFLKHKIFGGKVGDISVPGGDRGLNAAIVRKQATALGWGSGDMWDALAALINSESGFNNAAQNPTSTAYGMFQFLDSTWGIKGIRKTSDPALQTVAGLEYIRSRYGNPMNAWAFHKANNYYADGGEVGDEPGPVLYDSGGFLPPGLTTVLNASGRPEPVLTAQQWDKVEAGAMGGGGDTFPMTILDGPSANDIAEEILFAKRRAGRGGVYATRGSS